KLISNKNHDTLRIVSFNVRMWTDLADKDNFDRVLGVVKELNPDVLVMQEVNNWDKTYSVYTSLEYNTIAASCITNDPPFGVVIFAKNCSVIGSYGARFKNQRLPSRELCFVRLDLQVNSIPLAIYGTHLEVDQVTSKESMENVRALQLKEILSDTQILSHNHIIIAGDFNSVREKDYNYELAKRKVWDMVRQRFNAYGISLEPHVLALLEQDGYRSSFEVLNWNGPKYTAWAGLVLDFIFFSRNFSKSIIGSYVYYTDISDHLPIIVDIHK
ncbi:MAG TPA: endonuclease/exonuclease/phosphatase family protein, partial [Candidatus Babeliaceae bacterium]|nr:endonuclease/exonuclease/phosphatase family protein [Candidatus Babeliaceae bacterium]